MEITFILPTINRKKFVTRAIDSCLHINKQSQNIKAKVLVLDGFSDDGAWEIMRTKYQSNKNVILKQFDRNLGFQETAFIGLKLVNTEYCTYMYNDDVISPFYWKLAHKLKNNKQTFIMGYGKNEKISKIIDFKEPIFKSIYSKDIILNYFGYFNSLNYSSLPVSPVPCLSKTSNLIRWEKEVRDFVKESNFRKELMLKKNIGPDLILYLYNLMIQNDNIIFCNSTMAQLSFHKKSMSIIYGKQPLSTGYWLARVWYFEKYLNNYEINKSYSSKLSAYLIISGFYIFILNLIFLNFSQSMNVLSEILKVVKKIFYNKLFFETVYNSMIVLINRMKRRKKFLTPC